MNIPIYVISDNIKLPKIKKWLQGKDVYFGVDIETECLNEYDGEIVTIQIATEEKIVVLDLQFLDKKQVTETLAEFFNDSAKVKVIHNAYFESVWLRHHFGFEFKSLYCTMLMAQLVYAGNFRLSAGLAGACHTFLGIILDKQEQTSFKFGQPLTKEQVNYAGLDAWVVLPLRKQLNINIQKYNILETALWENLAIPNISYIHTNGFKLDAKKWVDIAKFNESEVERLHKEIIIDSNSDTLNLNAPAQVKAMLARNGVFVANTGVDTLKELEHPLVKKVLSYRKASKAVQSFGMNVLDYVNPKTKRIHSNIRQIGAKCITGNSLIPTDKGFLRLEELGKFLKNGEQLPYGVNIANRYLEFEPTSHIVKYTNVDTVKITTALGFELEGTLDHPIITNKYSHNEYIRQRRLDKFNNAVAEKWTTLEDCKIGECVKIPITYQSFSKEYVVCDITPYEKKTNGKDATLPTSLDENLAEFMGIYYADGSIHDSNGSFSIRIHNSNKDVISRVTELSLELFDLLPTFEDGITTVTCKYLAPLEHILELKRDCHIKHFPTKILQSPKSVVTAFIRGMFLDSHIFIEGSKISLRMTISNEQAGKDLQAILLAFGIVASFRKAGKSLNCWQITLTNNEYVKFKEKIGFIENEKCVKWKHSRKANTQYITGKNYIWVKIKAIKLQKNDVYDFTVPKTHSFIANGIISHNTGRLSASNINLMQIPHDKEVRSCFVAEQGNKLIIADYSQFELRIVAQASKEPLFLHAYQNNVDLHNQTSSLVFKLPIDAVPKETREIGKRVNFGTVYGIGAGAFSEKFGIEEDEADKIIWEFFKIHATLNNWLKNQTTKVKGLKFTTSASGRMVNLKKAVKKGDSPHNLAKNFPIQATNADVVKMVAYQLTKILHKYNAKFVNIVHDEVVLECPAKYETIVANLLKQIMIRCAERYIKVVPVEVEVTISDVWEK